MKPLVLIKYPLDLTGRSPANKIAGEPHSLVVAGNRAFVPQHGPFYTKSLVVRRASTGEVLSRNTHYKAVQLFVEATIRSGQEVCSVIVISDDTIGMDFTIDYQVVGGDYSTSVDSIQQLIDSLELDHRSVQWGSIIGKPERFPAAPHLHDVGDVYGWEYVVAELEAIRQAILMGDEASHRELIQYVDHQDGLIKEDLAQLRADYNAHSSNMNNPHNTTKAQVGLGNVQNFGLATTADAVAGTSNALYMTPVRVKEAIDKFAGDALRAHIDDKNNPHGTTKAQVGLGNVDNYATATDAQAIAGTATNLFVTPANVKAAVAQQALVPLNAHINNKSNPHEVTKAQVGLGNVQNYGIASNAEALAGTINTAYMTPLLVKNVIDQVMIPVNAHIGDRNNPHQTTKAQVGLGNVDNFATATEAEARAGALNDRMMTPLRVAQAIATQALAPLNDHVNNRNNPHGVTSTQVGLGNVTNNKQVRNTGGNDIQLRWANGQIEATVDATYMGRVHTTAQPDPSIAAHATNGNNPHGTNKWHVGLGNINDWPAANAWDIGNGTGGRYVPADALKAYLDSLGIGAGSGALENYRGGQRGFARLGPLLVCFGWENTSTNNQTYPFMRAFSQRPAAVGQAHDITNGSPSRSMQSVDAVNQYGLRFRWDGIGVQGVSYIAIGTPA